MPEPGNTAPGWTQVGAAIAAEGLDADKMSDLQLSEWVLDVKFLIDQCEQAIINAANSMIEAGRKGTWGTMDGGEISIGDHKKAKVVHDHDAFWALVPMLIEEAHANDRELAKEEGRPVATQAMLYEQVLRTVLPDTPSARFKKTGLRNLGVDPRHVINGEGGYVPCDPYINVRSAGTVSFLRNEAEKRKQHAAMAERSAE